MTEKTEGRIREIRRRTKQKRRKKENRELSVLTVVSLFLMIGIQGMLDYKMTPGISMVTDSYSTVLLREGTSGYIVTAIAAFVLGVTVTIICIHYKKRQQRHEENENENSNSAYGQSGRNHGHD